MFHDVSHVDIHRNKHVTNRKHFEKKPRHCSECHWTSFSDVGGAVQEQYVYFDTYQTKWTKIDMLRNVIHKSATH